MSLIVMYCAHFIRRKCGNCSTYKLREERKCFKKRGDVFQHLEQFDIVSILYESQNTTLLTCPTFMTNNLIFYINFFR
jgi:hypothetical protein